MIILVYDHEHTRLNADAYIVYSRSVRNCDPETMNMNLRPCGIPCPIGFLCSDHPNFYSGNPVLMDFVRFVSSF